MVMAATVFGMMAYHGFSPILCYGACIASAWGLSMANGYLVRGLKIPAIIVTLAGLPFYRGAALILADLGIPDFGGHITVHDEAYHAPGNQYAGWILLIVLSGALLWERYGQTPRRMLGMGSSEEACRLMGLSPGGIRQSAFFAGGLFLGVASLIEVTRLQAIEPARMVLGLELRVIGTVILGGTNIFGGEGSFLGTILGAFFLYFISQVLTYAEAGAYFEEALTGFIIIAVIGLDCALHRRRKLLEELA
jgi:ribose/xylose/arabinose/galactoside ABC-type transport system permease subunit